MTIKKAALIGRLATLKQLIATNQAYRPKLKLAKKTNLTSHLYLTTQLKQMIY